MKHRIAGEFDLATVGVLLLLALIAYGSTWFFHWAFPVYPIWADVVAGVLSGACIVFCLYMMPDSPGVITLCWLVLLIAVGGAIHMKFPLAAIWEEGLCGFLLAPLAIAPILALSMTEFNFEILWMLVLFALIAAGTTWFFHWALPVYPIWSHVVAGVLSGACIVFCLYMMPESPAVIMFCWLVLLIVIEATIHMKSPMAETWEEGVCGLILAPLAMAPVLAFSLTEYKAEVLGLLVPFVLIACGSAWFFNWAFPAYPIWADIVAGVLSGVSILLCGLTMKNHAGGVLVAWIILLLAVGILMHIYFPMSALWKDALSGFLLAPVAMAPVLLRVNVNDMRVSDCMRGHHHYKSGYCVGCGQSEPTCFTPTCLSRRNVCLSMLSG